MPPWTRGCNVLTRPSSISGKPVMSLMSCTFSPASASVLRVPPVEISSTPKLAKSLANSTRPVLSLTLSKARRMVRGDMGRTSNGDSSYTAVIAFTHEVADGSALDCSGGQGTLHLRRDHWVSESEHRYHGVVQRH